MAAPPRMSPEGRAQHREAMRNLSAEERQAFREKVREEMWKRAQESGMATPEKPAIPEPPVGPKEGSRTRMSPEDWQAYREKRHAEMKKQAEAAGVPFPEEPQMPVPGSVRVPALFEVESFPNVHHLVSRVSGTLAPWATGCFRSSSMMW